MRTVVVLVRNRSGGKDQDGKGQAKFHAWGCDYEEFETGAGNYSTAIVERESGAVENVPVDLIKFIG